MYMHQPQQLHEQLLGLVHEQHDHGPEWAMVILNNNISAEGSRGRSILVDEQQEIIRISTSSLYGHPLDRDYEQAIQW